MGYMLKVVVFEDRWQKNMVEIIDLCKKADIKEIFIMEQYHEILLTPYTVDKHRAMADICRKMAEEFRNEGIVFNVNIGTIVGHVGSEIQEDMVLPFQKFVGDNLCETNACYCILDEGWQDYAAEVCSLYAVSKPDKIFIDDDFRSLNHTAMFGCFCPIHVAETSKVCGMELTAESLLKHVCGGSGSDMKVKEAWMKVNFEGQLAAARKMRIATEKVSPLTRIGLMNSGENAHSVQGRDMDRLLREFSGDGRKPLSRPAGGGYRDAIHGEMFGLHQTMALSVSVLG
ncbi:MAG: hypothetical protein FIA99_18420 [Ruminiclostridium sp.]|nr:hypothetical protein [Ruminiclostridium sp.]